MGRFLIILWLLLLGIPGPTELGSNTVDKLHMLLSYTRNNILNPMEALDLVKEAYASNFTKISLQEDSKDYFYKLDIADYYLVYEDTDNITGYYLFHLYEFVLDDMDTGIGHTVTYGWYWVNPYSADIWEYP